MTEQLPAIVEQLANELRARETERLVVLDDQDRIALDIDGDNSSAPTNRMEQLLGEMQRRYSVMHNHPQDTSLSISDITNLMRPGTKAVTAYGRGGSRYTARPIDGQTTLDKMAHNIYTSSHGIPQELRPHLTNEALKQLGAMEYEYELGETMRNLLTQNQKGFDRLLRAAVKSKGKR